MLLKCDLQFVPHCPPPGFFSPVKLSFTYVFNVSRQKIKACWGSVKTREECYTPGCLISTTVWMSLTWRDISKHRPHWLHKQEHFQHMHTSRRMWNIPPSELCPGALFYSPALIFSYLEEKSPSSSSYILPLIFFLPPLRYFCVKRVWQYQTQMALLLSRTVSNSS